MPPSSLPLSYLHFKWKDNVPCLHIYIKFPEDEWWHNILQGYNVAGPLYQLFILWLWLAGSDLALWVAFAVPRSLHSVCSAFRMEKEKK